MKSLYTLILLILTAHSFASDISFDSNQTTVDNNKLNFCLALSEKDLKYCSNIKNKDEKSSCFGILQKNSGYCTMIKDEDKKNFCLSIALSDINYCKKMTDDNKQNSCILFYINEEQEKEQDICKEKAK